LNIFEQLLLAPLSAHFFKERIKEIKKLKFIAEKIRQLIQQRSTGEACGSVKIRYVFCYRSVELSGSRHPGGFIGNDN